MDNPIQEIPQLQSLQPEKPIQSSNSSFLRTLSIGLGIVGIGIAIGIAGYFLGVKKSQPPVQKIATPTPLPT